MKDQTEIGNVTKFGKFGKFDLKMTEAVTVAENAPLQI